MIKSKGYKSYNTHKINNKNDYGNSRVHNNK